MDFLGKIEAKNRIRDPIYGFIYLTEDECKIVDLPIFQRLRRVHQLALTKYVYPAAEHSRFVHSLGVMNAATLIFQELYRNNEKIFEREEPKLIRQFKTLRFAALMHDIGHLPFSHAAEKFLLKGGKHEDLSGYIIENTPEIMKVLKASGIRGDFVSELIKGNSQDKILSRIISGEFDADRADYLLRDSHNCGVEYGIYDFIRYISSFEIDEKNNEIYVCEDNIPIVESLITARYYYNLQVPYHRTRQAADIALNKYLEEKAQSKNPFSTFDLKEKISLEDFIWFDDYTIIEEVKNDIKNSTSEWAPYVLRLEHLKCFEQITYNNKLDSQYKKEFEKELENKGFYVGKDYFIENTPLMHHKLVDSSDENNVENEKRKYKVRTRYDKIKKDLMECSPVLKGLKEYPNQIFRYFCKKEDFDKFDKIVKEIAKKERGEKNV